MQMELNDKEIIRLEELANEFKANIKDGNISFYKYNYSQADESVRIKDMLSWCGRFHQYLEFLKGNPSMINGNFLQTQQAMMTKGYLQPYQYVLVKMLGYEFKPTPHEFTIVGSIIKDDYLCQYMEVKDEGIEISIPKESISESKKPFFEEKKVKVKNFVKSILK